MGAASSSSSKDSPAARAVRARKLQELEEEAKENERIEEESREQGVGISPRLQHELFQFQQHIMADRMQFIADCERSMNERFSNSYSVCSKQRDEVLACFQAQIFPRQTMIPACSSLFQKLESCSAELTALTRQSGS